MPEKPIGPGAATGKGSEQRPGFENLFKKPVAEFYARIADPTRRLVIAVYEGDADQAIAAIAAGADVNAIHPGTEIPVMHLAAGGGHTAVVERILQTKSCDLTVRDTLDRLPSDCAAYSAQDFEMAELLAEEEARQFRASGKDPRRSAAR